MGVPAELVDGSAAEAVAYDGKLLAVVTPRALAPGQPAQLHVHVGEAPLSLAGRSIGSRLREDGRFDVRLRLVNLTREARQALLQALGPDA